MYVILQHIYLLVLFLVAFYSLYLRLIKGKQQDFLSVYLGITLFVEILMYVIYEFFNDNSNFGFLYNGYIFFCAYFFLKYFNRNQKIEFVRLNNINFSIFVIVYAVFILKNYQEVNQIIGISFSMIYIIYSLIWFYGKLKYPDSNTITDDSKFWISTALLFWSVFFILRIIPRYLFSKIDDDLLLTSQSFFFIINSVFYLLLFVSIMKYSKRL